MTVYRQTYSKGGRTRYARKFYVRFMDMNDRERRLPAFSDKGTSEELDRLVHRLVRYRSTTSPLEKSDVQALEALPPKMHERLERLGLIDPSRAAAAKLLVDHLKDYERALLALDRNPDRPEARQRYARQVVGRARRLLVETCGFAYPSDIEAGRVKEGLASIQRKKGLSPVTRDHYLAATHSLVLWLLEERRLREDPLAAVQPLRSEGATRRAFSARELEAIIAATREGPIRCGMSPADRALYYSFLIATALRPGEAAQLRCSDFHLDESDPYVAVRAAYAKNGERVDVPLDASDEDLLAALADHLSRRLPAAFAFDLPCARSRAPMFRQDVFAAGLLEGDGDGKLPSRDPGGLMVDLYCLRHSSLTLIARVASPAVLQRFGRHKTPGLALRRYVHLRNEDIRDAQASLPRLMCSSPREEQQKATGTEGGSAEGSGLAMGLAEPQSEADLHESAQDRSTTRGGRSKAVRAQQKSTPAAFQNRRIRPLCHASGLFDRREV